MTDKTLYDCMDGLYGEDEFSSPAFKYKDVKVIKEFFRSNDGYKEWIGKHKNVHYWCILENGMAVAMNENPAVGITYPVCSIKKKMDQYL